MSSAWHLFSRLAPSLARYSIASRHAFGSSLRHITDVAAEGMSCEESKIAEKLKQALKVHSLIVKDTSGGCGEFYTVDVVAEDFRGLPKVRQHQLVHKILAEDLRSWHGLNLNTQAPVATGGN